ncbi:hypothetical protein [Sulfurovum sp.]|uniref:hypothetical protein n=1 Tax=Sulfurovum sp. TaxID=1969726 RepID=UPI0035625176
MKITVTNSKLPFTSIMKITFFGYFIGMGLVIIPFVLLDVGGMSENTNRITAIIIIPIILAIQAVLLGLVLNLGLFIYSKVKPIEVEHSENQQNL